MTTQELFKNADDYKNMIDKNGPYKLEQLAESEQYFCDDFIKSNNEIEGITLLSGYTEALVYMLSYAKTDKLEISEAIIKKLHYLFCEKMDGGEAGQYRKLQINSSGTDSIPPLPEDVPHFMEHFINQMKSSGRFMHPIEFATMCHKRMIDIHPFQEGNGVIAWLLMNLILVNAGYGIASISPVHQDEYKNALRLSQRKNNPDIDTLIKFITERVIESEREYCRLLRINF